MSRRPAGLLTGLLTAILVATLLVVPPASAATVSAQSLLDDLTTTSESHTTTYDRDLFNHWVDADGDGCDTRAEVLKDESSVATGHTGTCTITSGSWTSPYDGVKVTSAGDLDIDHMVPLKEAWISGAWDWSASRRQAFANDLGYSLSLIAVTASSNRSKSDQDPDSWLPPLASYRCQYVKQWIAVKWRWNLTVDSAEASALRSGLSSCSSLSVAQPSRA
ncbi:MAG: HNH endonuclease family protein [Aeromicrobium erythreum]